MTPISPEIGPQTASQSKVGDYRHAKNIQLNCTSSSSTDNAQTFIPYLKEFIVLILKDLGIKNPKVILDKEAIDAIRKKSSNNLIGQTAYRKRKKYPCEV